MHSKVWLNYYYYDDYYSQRKKSLSKTILQSSCEHWTGGWLLQSFLLSTVAGKGSLLAMSLLGWVTKSTVMKNIHSISSLAKVNVPSYISHKDVFQAHKAKHESLLARVRLVHGFLLSHSSRPVTKPKPGQNQAGCEKASSSGIKLKSWLSFITEEKNIFPTSVRTAG